MRADSRADTPQDLLLKLPDAFLSFGPPKLSFLVVPSAALAVARGRVVQVALSINAGGCSPSSQLGGGDGFSSDAAVQMFSEPANSQQRAALASFWARTW